MTPKTTAPESITKLIETFEQNLDSYRSSKNETELRREFLDKFFTALGWDVANEKGYDEAGKEVVHEFSVDVAGKQKKADYAFRVGRGDRFDFLVEAKKPSVNIENSPEAAYQLRRYGWSAKLPLNILTDFEHFAVYDCRARPGMEDKASVGRILLIHYKEYAKRWDEIASVFSPEAVRKGSFARYAEGTKGKKGTADVDDAFLQEIERWRELLAKNIALRNPTIDIAGLNYIVQMTIDRIVFLRICEERGIEPENQLLDIATPSGAAAPPTLTGTRPPNTAEVRGMGGRPGGGRVYSQLCNLFQRADTKYNSGLFHFKSEKGQSSPPDELTLSIEIDDKVLKDILSNLYYPKSPYAFLYIPADILGQVYERFLGKVIRLTTGHQAKVEEKPEVRKAGGVYYTPTYIVEYIVKNTVGKLLSPLPVGEGRVREITPAEAAKLKIVDPACGSGTFLLGAYQFLLDWHLNWYVNNDPEKWVKQKALTPAPLPAGEGGRRVPEGGRPGEGSYRLTTAKKKEILLNNLYGVDIDAQAVEVTKLSLLLKVLENASGQMDLGLERVLPDLGNNIQCGNSLIGWDYFAGQLLPDEEEIRRVNPFDWRAEFKDVFAKGGFDVVIGNPPYGAEFSKESSAYLQKRYETFVWRGESYLAFVEKAHNLLRISGKFGFIIPDTYLNLGFTQSIRTYLLQNANIQEIVLLPTTVFSSASVDTTLLFTEKANVTNESPEFEVSVKIFSKKASIGDLDTPSRSFLLGSKSWNPKVGFLIQSDDSELSVLSHIEAEKNTLGDMSEMFYGIKVYQIGKGKPPQTEKIRDSKPFTAETQLTQDFLPFYDGKHIGRYQLLWDQNNWLHYGPWLAEPRVPKKFEGEKLLIRKIIGETLIATYVSETSYCNTLLYVVKLLENATISYKYLLGTLNSKLIGWYFRKKFQISADDTFPQILIRDIMQFPIVSPEQAQHDQMTALVEQMLALHKKTASANTPQEKERLERQIRATDSAIDALVYELYGLSDDEIKIVEAGFSKT